VLPATIRSGAKSESTLNYAEAGERLDDANRAVLDADQQKAELTSTVEHLIFAFISLTKGTVDAQAMAKFATQGFSAFPSLRACSSYVLYRHRRASRI
jgi:hypothetical protein